jgi:AbrB family looped-hinge helix DNA binding protein
MADLVRVKDKFQVTLPAAVRRELAVQEGDYLEATVNADGILLRPARLAAASSSAPAPAPAPAKPAKGLTAFIAASRPGQRSRAEIDAALLADRNTWPR